MNVEQYTEYLIQCLSVDEDGNEYWGDHQFYDNADDAIKRYLYLLENAKELTFRPIERITTDRVLSI